MAKNVTVDLNEFEGMFGKTLAGLDLETSVDDDHERIIFVFKNGASAVIEPDNDAVFYQPNANDDAHYVRMSCDCGGGDHKDGKNVVVFSNRGNVDFKF